MMINGREDEYFLYELTLTQDVEISYGEQGLIVPEAILLKSDLLYCTSIGLVAEWGLRTKPKETNGQGDKPVMDVYCEVNKYYQLSF